MTQEATQPLPQAGIPAQAPPTTEAAGEEPPAPGYAPGPPPRKSKAALLVGLIGGVLVVAGIVVLVLWLTMWRDGGGGTDEPIALAEKYISAMEKGQPDAYLACFEEGFLEDTRSQGMDMRIAEESFEMMTVRGLCPGAQVGAREQRHGGDHGGQRRLFRHGIRTGV